MAFFGHTLEMKILLLMILFFITSCQEFDVSDERCEVIEYQNIDGWEKIICYN